MTTRAIKAIVRKDGKILLIKKSEKVDIYPGRWDLPGGRLESGESWNQGLAREIKEETGINVKLICEVREWTSEKWDTIGKTVLCDYVSGEIKLSWEHTEYQWLSPEEIVRGDFPEWIQNDVKAVIAGKN